MASNKIKVPRANPGKKMKMVEIDPSRIKCLYCEWWKQSIQNRGIGWCLCGRHNHGTVTGFLDGNGCPEFVLTQEERILPPDLRSKL